MKLVFFLMVLLMSVTESTMHQCSNRFEHMDDIREALPQLKNCTFVKAEYPMCKEHIVVMYTHQPPYVIAGENGTTTRGLLPDMLRLVFNTCCYGCTNISFRGPVEPMEMFKTHDSNITLFMSVESALTSEILLGRDYIPLMSVRRVSVLAKEMSNRSNEYTVLLILTVLKTWPLLLTALLMATIR